MTNLKKIAAEMRESQIFNKGSLHKWADALDALAAQGPVAWKYGPEATRWHNAKTTQPEPKTVAAWGIEHAYAAPQRMTVSREALLEAFMIYADPQMVRVTYSVEKLRALGIEVTND